MGDASYWWMAFPMIILTLIVIAAAVWIVITLTRGGAGSDQAPNQARISPVGALPSAEQILAERLARGEIDVEEYGARMGALRRLPPGS